jgi:hypothetical protein
MPTKSPAPPPLDPIEALKHIKTLARAGQDAPDEAAAQKLFEMIVELVNKALPKKRSPRHGD